MSKGPLFSLLQSFASLALVKNMEWPSSTSPDEIQDYLTEQLILSEFFQSTHPASSNYQRSFWKWVISNLREQGVEVREEISYSAGQTVNRSHFVGPAPSGVLCYLDISRASNGRISEATISNCRRCTLFEARTTIENGTTGLRTWTASFVLAECLISNCDISKSSRIPELGSGAGFLGIIQAQLQIAALFQSAPPNTGDVTRPSLYLTDLSEQVLTRCESNLKLPCNSVLYHPELQFKVLDWSDSLDETRKDKLTAFLSKVKADLILGADVVYDIAIIPALVAMLHLALALDPTNPSGKRAVIATTLRNESTLDTFVQKSA